MNVAPVDLTNAPTQGPGLAPEIQPRPDGKGIEVIISDRGVDGGRQSPITPSATNDREDSTPVRQRDLGLYTGRGMAFSMPAEALQGQLLDVTG